MRTSRATADGRDLNAENGGSGETLMISLHNEPWSKLTAMYVWLYRPSLLVPHQATIFYRNVARDSKIHLDAAKRIFYDLHVSETEKEPGSVQTTSLLVFMKKADHKVGAFYGHTNGTQRNNEEMLPSPTFFMSSMLKLYQRHKDSKPSQRDALLARISFL